MYTVARIIAGLILLAILWTLGWWGFGVFAAGVVVWHIWHYRKYGYWPGDQYHPDFVDPKHR